MLEDAMRKLEQLTKRYWKLILHYKDLFLDYDL